MRINFYYRKKSNAICLKISGKDKKKYVDIYAYML